MRVAVRRLSRRKRNWLELINEYSKRIRYVRYVSIKNIIRRGEIKLLSKVVMEIGIYFISGILAIGLIITETLLFIELKLKNQKNAT